MTAPWIQRCFFLIITITTTAGTRDCVDARQISTEAILCASVCVCVVFFFFFFFYEDIERSDRRQLFGDSLFSLSLSLSPRPSFIKSDPRVKDGARRLRDSSEREMV